MYGRNSSPIQKTINIMAQRKKTADNPPLSLRNALIKNSVANTWGEALPEWEMRAYYYLPPGNYKSCPCSPKGINNITVLVNKHNSKQMEICNRCAELYFEISESRSLEGTARRVRNNKAFVMNIDALDYLLLNRGISFWEHQCYDALKNKRSDPEVIKFKEEMNGKLINFTDYNNKPAFDDIDNILVWAQDHPKFDITPVVIFREEIINTGVVNMDALESIIEDYDIERMNYTYSEIEVARLQLEEFRNSENIDFHLKKAFYENLPGTFTPIGLLGYQTKAIFTREKYLEIKYQGKRELNQIELFGMEDLHSKEEPVIYYNIGGGVDEYGLEEGVDTSYDNLDNEPIISDEEMLDFFSEKHSSHNQSQIENQSDEEEWCLEEDIDDWFRKEQREKLIRDRREAFKQMEKDALYRLGLLVTKYMTEPVDWTRIIDFKKTSELAYDFIVFLEVPEIVTLFRKSSGVCFFPDLFEICDDEHLGYLLSGVIMKTNYFYQGYVIDHVNDILVTINKSLVFDEKSEGRYHYKVVNCNERVN